MPFARFPEPVNEPVRAYAPGSTERKLIKAELARISGEIAEIPLVIGGESVRSGPTEETRSPHLRQKVIARWFSAGAKEAEAAILAAEAARPAWSRLSLVERSSVFLRAADLLAGPWRDRMNAATMLGQSKTIFQAEIDAACELIDFLRFNVQYASELERMQPMSPPGMWNRVEMRPLDGFVYAISPFNFTAIAGNLPAAPALLGNTVVWKPAATQMLAAGVVMDLFRAAGLPPGVINFVPGDPVAISDVCLASANLGGIHFTGSTQVFQTLWRKVGERISSYRQYPRIVGETGGKDFIFAHPTAKVDALVTAIIRGGFEYQGQKCSAASRVYVPKSLWKETKERLAAEIATIKFGDVANFSNFMGAVIDERSYTKITGYLERAKKDTSASIVAGGNGHNKEGWFIEPTLVEVTNPQHELMRDELFGPVVTTWVYEDREIDRALELVDTTTAYALTGAIFAEDRSVVPMLADRLRNAAGNFYVNDKPTGAVVGQQPFGGGRASGTNDKAGSAWNLMRWISPRTIKETFVPPTQYRYPFMSEE